MVLLLLFNLFFAYGAEKTLTNVLCAVLVPFRCVLSILGDVFGIFFSLVGVEGGSMF
jgi:signal peptidase I